MAQSLEEIKEAALALPESERLQLLESLSESLSENSVGSDPEVEQAWVDEAKRRWAALQSGNSKFVSGEQVLASARAHLDAQF